MSTPLHELMQLMSLTAMIAPVKHKLRRHPPLSSFATTGG